jgi:hypothetical protein
LCPEHDAPWLVKADADSVRGGAWANCHRRLAAWLHDPGALTARRVGVAPSIEITIRKPWNGADDRFPQPQVVLLPGAALSQPKSDLSDFGRLKVPNSGKPEFGGEGAANNHSACGSYLSPSRSRGAFLRPGLAPCFAHPESRGGRSAKKRSGRVRSTRGAYDAIRQALARRPASHDAGRSPLGAPPWRFFTRPRFLLRQCLRIRRASSSQPGRSAWRATYRASRGEPPPQTPHLAPPSGSSLEDAPR